VLHHAGFALDSGHAALHVNLKWSCEIFWDLASLARMSASNCASERRGCAVGTLFWAGRCTVGRGAHGLRADGRAEHRQRCQDTNAEHKTRVKPARRASQVSVLQLVFLKA